MKMKKIRESLIERHPDMKDQLLNASDTAVEIIVESQKLTKEEKAIFIRFLEKSSKFSGKNEGF